LVADDRWFEELLRLVDSARERRKLAKHGAKWVANETIERNVGVWERTLADALARGERRVLSYA
jgi:hypothetical protein